MKFQVILIVIGALGTVSKGMVKELESLEIRERIETIHATVLLRLLRRVREAWEDLLLLRLW